MNLLSKIFVIIVAILINIFVWYAFRETRDFENETQSFIQVPAVYEGETQKVCNKDGCGSAHIYNYVVRGDKYRIKTQKMASNLVPQNGAIKLVKYDSRNPNLAFFTKVNLLYLFYLIEFVLLFVTIWVLFSKPKEQKVIIDSYGNEVKIDNAKSTVYIGQAIVSAIFTLVCVGFFFNMASNVGTFQPVRFFQLTHPAGLVLCILTLLGIFMTIWSYKRR